MLKINSGRGTLGRFIHDSTIAQNLMQIIGNLKETSKILDETIDETKDNVFAFMSSLQVTAGNAEILSQQLEEISVKINSGGGTLGRLIQDTIIAENLNQTLINLKNSSRGLDENMEAAKHNFLLKGYFKKKVKEAEQKRKDALEKEEEVLKVADEKK
jgi:phospholipid/cholesterol/gamma-HCH transport system substrate-binding protein